MTKDNTITFSGKGEIIRSVNRPAGSSQDDKTSNIEFAEENVISRATVENIKFEGSDKDLTTFGLFSAREGQDSSQVEFR